MAMTSAFALLGMLAFLPALFCGAAAADVARGHPRGREFFASLGAVEERLSADDAPLWAEALGTALGPGFTLRAASHALAAVIGRHDPTLVDNDVALGSSVASLRSEPLADVSGRLFSALLGVGVYVALQPTALVVPGPDIATLVVRVWVSANILVLLTDPLQMLINMTQTHTNKPTRGDA